MDKLNIVSFMNDICGEKNVITDDKEMHSYNIDWDKKFYNSAICAVTPINSSQISTIMKFCYENNIKVVPQGGNTGLVGGSTPAFNDIEVIINLKKMNKIYEIDELNYSIDLDAGVILEDARALASKKNLLLPLSMASAGSSQIGGIIATNAGGINVIKYGNIRDQLLGIEAVMHDGTTINVNSKMKKNNSGFDIKNLLCGSEGTLGIITRATLNLSPKPSNYHSFFISFKSISSLINFYRDIRNKFNQHIDACEFITNKSFEISTKHKLIQKHFFSKSQDYYLLIRFLEFEKNININNVVLDYLLESQHLYKDVIVPQNSAHENEFWEFRENLTEAQRLEGHVIHNDISLPINKLEIFFKEAMLKIGDIKKDIIIYPFGHLGDSNIHFNIIDRNKTDNVAELESLITNIINKLVMKYGGSISAEHGIGQLKKNTLLQYLSPESLGTMKIIKNSLDPKNILNPGKIFDI